MAGRREAAMGLQALVAAKIRAELVCCNIYQRLEDLHDAGDNGKWKRLRWSNDYHDICFYGEWAARIAERVSVEGQIHAGTEGGSEGAGVADASSGHV